MSIAQAINVELYIPSIQHEVFDRLIYALCEYDSKTYGRRNYISWNSNGRNTMNCDFFLCFVVSNFHSITFNEKYFSNCISLAQSK